MSKVRVNTYSMSIDGFGAAPGQTLDNPFGVGGKIVTNWMMETKFFMDMIGGTGGSTGVDHQVAVEGMKGIGAWILGRNMFGPDRGEWDMDWKGWWGPNPPYHTPVFVLSHHVRPSLVMEGGNVFHFVTGGIHDALEKAHAAAGDKDIRIGGGASTLRQYLEAGLIDEMHLAITPTLLGAGESPIHGLNLRALGYSVSDSRQGENALHVFFRKSA
jgi:dihydrofolate reductase